MAGRNDILDQMNGKRSFSKREFDLEEDYKVSVSSRKIYFLYVEILSWNNTKSLSIYLFIGNHVEIDK